MSARSTIVPPLETEFLTKRGYAAYVLMVIAAAAVYFGAARLGLSLAFLHASVSPVWPPTGIAIAAILWLGYRISPAILLGAFLANLATGTPPVLAGGIAIGNTLEAVSAGFLLHRFVGSHSPFYAARDVLRFVLIAVLISPMVSATIGNGSLVLGGAAAPSDYGRLWLTWWIGDGVGALVVAPLVLTWVERRGERWAPRQWVEALLLLISLSAASIAVFREALPSNFINLALGRLIVPFLLWAAFRLGPRGVATAVAVFSGIAIWGTRLGLGPFVEQSPNDSLLLLQVTVAANGIMFLVLAGVLAERRDGERALSLLASIVESTDDAVIGRTLDGIILSWNRGAEQIYGYGADEVIGRPLSILVPSDREQELPEMLEKLRAGEHIDRFETKRVRKDGQIIDVSLTVSPIRDAAGKTLGGSVIARDITERKQAQEALTESEAQLASMIGSAMDAIITIDSDQRIVVFNAAAEKMFRCSAQEALGQSIQRFIPERFRAEHKKHIRVFGDTNVTKRAMGALGSLSGVRADGREFPIEASISQIEVKEQKLYTVILRDITERERAAEEREQLLAAEQEARAEAEAANRAKDEFLALVSHELRTPLNSIAGWVEILLAKPERDDAQIARALAVIKRNVALQARIIEDILDVSSVVAGKLQLDVRPVELPAIIQAAVAAVQVTADNKNVQLRQVLDHSTDPVLGDPYRLQQIVWNLLSNAIKFTPDGGGVEIRLEQTGLSARVTVSDTGEGIRPEFLPRIFDRFSQADTTTTRTYGGLGLGLAIVRHLVEMHGGTVEAFSEGENKGSVFTITLPCEPARVESRVPRGSSKADPGRGIDSNTPLAGLRVLVVDDDLDSREVLAAVLALCAAEVRSAGSVREALDVLTDWTPDVLVSDIGMPGQDGYDLIREVRLRTEADGGQIPAVALTGYAAVQDGERALSAGYQSHMAKPVEPLLLVEVIASLVRNNAT